MLKVAVVGAGNMARCHMDVAAHLNDVEMLVFVAEAENVPLH